MVLCSTTAMGFFQTCGLALARLRADSLPSGRSATASFSASKAATPRKIPWKIRWGFILVLFDTRKVTLHG